MIRHNLGMSPLSPHRPMTALSIVASIGYVAMAILCSLSPISAQQTGQQETLRYPLANAPAKAVVERLPSLLGESLARQTRMMADPSGNAIIVQAPSSARPQIQNIIRSLDQPVLPAKASVPDRTLRGYRIDANQINAVFSQLRQHYAGQPGIDLSIDHRTGQLVVFATDTIHRQIASQLAEMTSANQPAQQTSGFQSPPSAAVPVTSAPSMSGLAPPVMALRHLAPSELQYKLQRLGGASIVFSEEADGTRVLAQIRDGQQLRPLMRIDRAAKRVELLGSPSEITSWRRVITAMDNPQSNGQTTQLLPLGYSDPQQIRHTMNLLRSASAAAGEIQAGAGQNPARPNEMVMRIFTQDKEPGSSQNPNGTGQETDPPTTAQPAEGVPQPQGVLGDVQIEFVPELGVIVLRGREADVRRVREIIRQIEAASQDTKPEIHLLVLKHTNNESLGALIETVYEEVYEPRLGSVSITPLVKPNALLVIGKTENVGVVAELVEKLDHPVQPSAVVKVFQLKYLASADAQTYLQTFYGADQGQQTEPVGLATRVNMIADPRSNSLVVQASPSDMKEVETIIKRLDVDKTAGMLDLRVFPLKNALASDLATVLQNSLGIQAATGTGQQPQPAQGQNQTATKTVQIVGVDSAGHRTIKSGILTDVSVAADENTNSLIVRASPQSMPLIARLIEQLDAMPSAESQIKVFQIENGDATNLTVMLQQLFGLSVTAGSQGAFSQALGSTFGQVQLSQQTAGESSLIPLRFGVDARTNSIIATGSTSDLAVVEAILLRLDEGDLRQRKTQVYRLNNAPAQFVSDALQLILQQTTQLLSQQQQQQFSLISQFEFVDSQIFVVPEVISNSLIVSATPKYFEQISEVIADLDRRPPMVMVQVVLARVTLDESEEFGVELGIQDSLLFDRSSVVDGLIAPGFNFINQQLGNADNTTSRGTRNNLAGQSYSAFNVGRSSAGSGFGGLVLSASSDSVNILIRALESESKLQVLSRPQIMTLNNVPASILVGQRVPRVSDFQQTGLGSTNSVTLDEVGLSLGLIPRVSPDGLITMDVEVNDSSVGPIEDGIPIGIQDGVAINSPIFDDITAVTTVTARSGQTVVFSGLISKERSNTFRGVPVLSHIPVLGRLFRFDTETEKRTELLIFLTPHIVNSGEYEDVTRINQIEANRMSWCLADVVELHGDPGFNSVDKGVFGPGRRSMIVPDGQPNLVSPQTPDRRPIIQPQVPASGSQPYLVSPDQLRENRPHLINPNIQPAPATNPANGSYVPRNTPMAPTAAGTTAYGQWQYPANASENPSNTNSGAYQNPNYPVSPSGVYAGPNNY